MKKKAVFLFKLRSWHLRLFGSPQEAYIYSPPYIFSPSLERNILEVLKKQLSLSFKKRAEENVNEDLLRGFYKEWVLFWMGCFSG